ncbi:hypothetical protein M426DRAFT_19365 [Hypoxylon sp. CI-4A]|nr:hypothetical protein M426DRAFT_19365 [Hypoxylon sp. CI-4A]
MATDWNKLKVVDLKAELKRLGQPQNGLKADLVARLQALDSDKPASEHSDEASEAAEDTNGESRPQQEAPQATEATESPPADEPVKQPKAETEAAPEAQDVPEPIVTDMQGVQPTSTDDTPPQPTEVLQDSQKRKRRSLSPAPSAHEIARKRARQEDPESQVDAPADPLPEKNNQTAPEKEETEDFTQATSDVEMQGAKDEAPIDPDRQRDDQVASSSPVDDAYPNVQNGHHAEVAANDTQLPFEESLEDKTQEQQPYATYATEIERDVEPAIHPATSALYIKDFMRPLRPQMVKDHLLDLATPVGAPIEDGTILDFYLDTIRTHAFVVFNSISSASRVRTALHNRVWPDETNRKALWVDFMPSERFAEWVDVEQASSGGRGSSSRFELVYENDDDGNMTVKLEEFDSTGPAPKSATLAPEPEPERKLSIPTGPSRPFSGIEGAPTGPRAGRGSAMQSGRSGRSDLPGLPTRTFPKITYQPVSDELARRRLDAITAAKTKDIDRDFGKEYKRYYFENGDTLVDRGPEIFLGIRPPHRERERQRGGDQRRDPPRNRRNPRPRRGMPIFHGVPRGGDRFRPGDSSAAGPNGRSRYPDDRGSRRDRYADDRGSRRDNHNRY